MDEHAQKSSSRGESPMQPYDFIVLPLPLRLAHRPVSYSDLSHWLKGILMAIGLKEGTQTGKPIVLINDLENTLGQKMASNTVRS